MFKNLKSLFVVEDETSSKKETKSTTPAKQKQEKPTPTTSTTSTASAKVDEQKMRSSLDKILKALADNNIEGYDYFEYKEALRSLKNEALPEAKKYELAFTMAKSMGLSTDKLLQTANHYVQVLQHQESAFNNALKAGYTRKIGEREHQLKTEAEQIKHKKTKIAQLNKEIIAHEKKLGQLNTVINKEKVNIQTTKISFEKALNQVKNQILLDIQNIKKYLLKMDK